MDKNYWRDYYASHRFNAQASLFATFVMEHYLTKGHRLLELGCGNGRDSMYFARHGVEVVAIDQVQEEIAYLNTYASSYEASSLDYTPPQFVAGDFTHLEDLHIPKEYDCIYSRFTLHSIDKKSQDKVLQDSLSLCAQEGILAIEVRGEKNALYGKGEAILDESGAFIYDNHYRRFLNFEDTLNFIENLRHRPACDNAQGGGYIMLLLIALRFLVRMRIEALPHLAKMMIILSAFLLKRCAQTPKATSPHYHLYSLRGL